MNEQDLERRIGSDALAAVKAAGWQPPDPPKIVTMAESRGRYVRVAAMSDSSPWTREQAERYWDANTKLRDTCNAADDWLVKTVNKRIIEGLVIARPDHAYIDNWMAYTVHLPSARRPVLRGGSMSDPVETLALLPEGEG